jgi:hypothetical protein
MTRSWHARRVIATDSYDNIADGVAGRYPIPDVLDDLLKVTDDAVLVQEASIIGGMRMLLEHAGLVVEQSAALGIAPIDESPQLNADGRLYYVRHRPGWPDGERAFWPDSRGFDTLEEAVTAAESAVPAPIRWQ